MYIEPILPKTNLVILGKSPVAQALARLAKILDYRVSVFVPEVDKTLFSDVAMLQDDFDLAKQQTAQTQIIVSTQGQDDEEALEAALKSKRTI